MMLEVFYETKSKIVTAWRRKKRQGIRPIRRGETRVMLDCEVPYDRGAGSRDYLYDDVNKTIMLRPDYVEPKSTRDLGSEMNRLCDLGSA